MPSTSTSVAELVEDWLTAKRALESAEQAEKGNSDRARQADLARWALVIAEAKGHSPTNEAPPITRLRLDDLSEEILVAAVARAKRRWSDATVARMLSTLRGFTRVAVPDRQPGCRPPRRRPLPGTAATGAAPQGPRRAGP